jgi:Tfp pilus assembly protein PilO
MLAWLASCEVRVNTVSSDFESGSTEVDAYAQAQASRLRLERMFNDHHDFIWRLLRRLGLNRGAADDAAQHVFLVAAERILDIQEGRERAFLFGTALRVARRVSRNEKRWVLEDDMDFRNSQVARLEDLADQRRAVDLMGRILANMDHDLKTVFILAELEGQRARLVTLRADIDRGVATANQLPQFRAQVTQLERRLDELKSILPDQKDAQDILRRVHTLATQSNLAIRSFNPKTSTKKQLHEEWPIEMQLEGSYHDLGYFFDRIARFPRIINIGDVQIRARDAQASASTITARCTAMTFVLLDAPAPAPGAGRAGGPGVPPAGAPR